MTAGREFRAQFTIHEAGTAWYIARCVGSDNLQTAITNPIYFEGTDYRPPERSPARVKALVTDRATGTPLDGEFEVIRMMGLTPTVVSKHLFNQGRLTIAVPATGRLRVVVPGYQSMMKSVFMDYRPLLGMTLDMQEAEVSDWRTFEEIIDLVAHVDLEFPLTRLQH